MLSVVGDVLVYSGASVVPSSISRICRFSLSEVLIGVGLRACIYRNECAYGFVSIYFSKKKDTASEARPDACMYRNRRAGDACMYRYPGGRCPIHAWMEILCGGAAPRLPCNTAQMPAA